MQTSGMGSGMDSNSGMDSGIGNSGLGNSGINSGTNIRSNMGRSVLSGGGLSDYDRSKLFQIFNEWYRGKHPGSATSAMGKAYQKSNRYRSAGMGWNAYSWGDRYRSSRADYWQRGGRVAYESGPRWDSVPS